MASYSAVLAVSLLAGGVQPEPPLVLILPIMGDAPREMQLPPAGEIAEALLLQISEGGVRVAAERPTSRVVPEEAERVFEVRGREVKARVVVWGELLTPADCNAPRRIKLRILDVATAVVLERVLCPLEAGAADLAGAIAVAVAASLRSGLIEGLLPPEKEKKAPAVGMEKMARAARLRCPPQKPCPPCEQPKAPEASGCPECPACPPPVRGPSRLVAGLAFSSHPRIQNPALGVHVGAGWLIHRRWEAGFDVAVLLNLGTIKVTEVRAVYHELPLSLWGRLRFGSERWEGLLDLGLVISWSRMDALLERFENSVRFERFDPALRLRGGVCWWVLGTLALELSAGGCYWLRTQNYNYLYLGIPVEVLKLERWSVESALSLRVAFGS